MTEQILLIADPATENNFIREALMREGYQVEAVTAARPDLIEQCLDRRPADAIVLVAEPEPALSFELCRQIRQRAISTPCLMVTVLAGSATAALRCGADDCVAGSAELAEIVARVGALLRRARMGREKLLSFGGVEVDVRRRRAVTPRGKVDLAPKEASLLAYLAARSSEIVSREELLREVWGHSTADTRTVDTHMAGLRRKIEPDPRRPAHLLTIRTRGYQFQF